MEEHYLCYLPISSADVRRGLYVTGWGSDRFLPGDAYPAGGHPDAYHFNWNKGRVLGDFAVVYLVEGRGEFEDRQLGKVRLAAGDVLLIPPGCWHRYRPVRSVGWREVWCTVNGEYLHRLRAQGGFPRAPLLRRLTDPTAFLAAMRRLHDTASVNSLLVESFALEAIARALEDNEVSHRGYEPAVTGEPWVDQALEYIWLNSHRPIDVADVATKLGTTRRTLERHFHRSHERSVAEELAWCRVERAKILLTESSMSAKEVSYATGFGDPKRMTRAFQSQVGKSPNRFRTGTGRD